MSDGVDISIDNHIGVFKLDREKALNSLTHGMIKHIHQHADDWSQREDISFFLFPCLQKKVYCAGGDIRWLYQQGKAGNHDQQMSFFADEYRLDYAIGKFAKPVVAIVDGFLIGGGMGLLIPANDLYATETAYFSMPETSIGFFPDVGMCHRLSKTPGYVGLYLTLTGQRINAYDAHYIGLVKGVINNEDAIQIEAMYRQTKVDNYLYDTITTQLVDKSNLKAKSFIEEHHEAINEVFSGESLELILDKLREMPGQWADQTLNQLLNACPLSLSITFELMRQVKGCDQRHAYQLDHAIAAHFMGNNDFYEGVRAQVIDKDRSPKWQFNQVSDVPRSLVNQFFSFPDSPLEIT